MKCFEWIVMDKINRTEFLPHYFGGAAVEVITNFK